MHVRFEYMYRDYGNYKNHAAVVFTNPDGISIEKIENLFESARRLMFPDSSESQFQAEPLGIPPVYFLTKTDEDHDWHEYVGFFETDEAAGAAESRSIGQFLAEMKAPTRKTRRDTCRVPDDYE